MLKIVQMNSSMFKMLHFLNVVADVNGCRGYGKCSQPSSSGKRAQSL